MPTMEQHAAPRRRTIIVRTAFVGSATLCAAMLVFWRWDPRALDASELSSDSACPSAMPVAKNSKAIGVIGGVGPKSTAEYYSFVTELYEAVGKKLYGYDERPLMLIYSLPLNQEKETLFIQKGEHKDMYVQEMVRAAKVLMESRVQIGVIPCNTIHQFLPNISSALQQYHADHPWMPVLEFKSIITTTIEMAERELPDGAPRKVLLLATGETVRTNLYNSEFKQSDLQVYVPASNDTRAGTIVDVTPIEVPPAELPSACTTSGADQPQDCVNQMETNILLDIGASDTQYDEAFGAFEPVLKRAFQMGIRVVVLGCTDFQLVVNTGRLKKLGLGEMAIVDSLDSLVVWSAMYAATGVKTSSDPRYKEVYSQYLAYDQHMLEKREADKKCPTAKLQGSGD